MYLTGQCSAFPDDVALSCDKSWARSPFFGRWSSGFLPKPSALGPQLCKQSGLTEMNDKAVFSLAVLMFAWAQPNTQTFSVFKNNFQHSSHDTPVISHLESTSYKSGRTNSCIVTVQFYPFSHKGLISLKLISRLKLDCKFRPVKNKAVCLQYVHDHM